jgi:hypothetical protein
MSQFKQVTAKRSYPAKPGVAAINDAASHSNSDKVQSFKLGHQAAPMMGASPNKGDQLWAGVKAKQDRAGGAKPGKGSVNIAAQPVKRVQRKG